MVTRPFQPPKMPLAVQCSGIGIGRRAPTSTDKLGQPRRRRPQPQRGLPFANNQGTAMTLPHQGRPKGLFQGDDSDAGAQSAGVVGRWAGSGGGLPGTALLAWTGVMGTDGSLLWTR